MTSRNRTTALAAVLLSATAAFAQGAAPSSPLAGRWDAAFTLNGTDIPFRLDISQDGQQVKGTLFNGDKETETTTSAKLNKGEVVLDFEHYLTTISANVNGDALTGKLRGRFEREKYIADYPFHASRHKDGAVQAAANVPNIAGNWEIPHETAKGEKSWRFIVKQNGAEAQASILRVDGDTGSLTGTYNNGSWLLSHFDGARPLLVRVTPKQDGTLEVKTEGAYTPAEPLQAYREEVARAKGLPLPEDYGTHTTVRDASERFAFKFPDVNGKLVSSEDTRFKNKVVLAIVTGTWCPNCHDEARYLVELDKKYRDKGLEIIALDFEEPEQQDSLSREKAFIDHYGVKYTYLLAGAPAEMWEKVPQAVNLNTWPATLFVGKDGRVRKIHSGFASPSSGAFNEQLKKEFTAEIEALLAEKDTQKLADNGTAPLAAHAPASIHNASY
ncbi:peroxiredoxin family protein [Terriglobus tenax]|uniref:peroxiredoxin family protein n=1 Tax=Terriglobus tenax TaxID=1111115 RepID=UPI0021DF53EB|nr:TlpA disulfide reductase family protein [Terriglobus tenax]